MIPKKFTEAKNSPTETYLNQHLPWKPNYLVIYDYQHIEVSAIQKFAQSLISQSGPHPTPEQTHSLEQVRDKLATLVLTRLAIHRMMRGS